MRAFSFAIGFVKGYASVIAVFVLIALFVPAIHAPMHTPVPARVAQLGRLHLAEVQEQTEESERWAQFRREGISP